MQPLATLTLQDFAPEDFEAAKTLCRKLGYGESYVYATSSDLPGLYLLPLRPTQPGRVICKSAEFGLIAIQIFED
jgi:hypothetical protein